MAPRKRHHIESLEELSLRVVLASVVADLHLAHLLSTDLRHSIVLSSLPVTSPDQLKKLVSSRLAILPGILNDQVRDRLVRRLFASSEPDRWVNAKLDILKAVLDISVTTIDCGEQVLPRQLLTVVGDCCPNLTSLKVILNQMEPYGDGLAAEDKDNPTAASVTLLPRRHQLLRETSFPFSKLFQEETIKMATATAAKAAVPCPLVSGLSSLTQLSTLHVMHGANNDILAALGQYAPKLKELRICYSYGVTDAGLKALCLRSPDNHVLRRGRHLHELRVRSFHLNPCCSTLEEVDILGTGISQYGVAFLLKHLPALRSLGNCTNVTEAIEVLVGNKSLRRNSFMGRLRKYASRFKLNRVKEDCVSASKLVVITTLCPELRDLSLTHRFCEVDLERLADLHKSPSHFRSHLTQLKFLKHLSLVNVASRSVSGAVQAVGQQLTALTVKCRGLDVPVVFHTCTNLKYLTMEGEDCSAPYEAVGNFRQTALIKLQVVKIKCHLPAPYTDIILNNARSLTRLEIDCLCDMSDDRVDQLMRNKSLEKLREFDVSRAPKLTVTSARMLVKHCPKLRQLQDLGGWNISTDELNAFLKETELENYDIQIVYKPRRARNDGHSDDDLVDDSDQDSDVWGPVRNLFPLVIL
ncbi:uncharacterized protein [Procambarus clarkii]|uniref:uncharacterized protein n=1 Tax=Procambarus clarkii TaxID=6728 RepID=UPI001E678961|nr:uncharacterized protein LOC123758347 [Procambarus clarkii]XP_045598599.1 uncharacterized protein LOC123758347 [Procambarus clarkii]